LKTFDHMCVEELFNPSVVDVRELSMPVLPSRKMIICNEGTSDSCGRGGDRKTDLIEVIMDLMTLSSDDAVSHMEGYHAVIYIDATSIFFPSSERE